MRTPTATHLVALQKYRNMHGDHEATAIALGRLLHVAWTILDSARVCGVCRGLGLVVNRQHWGTCRQCGGLGFVVQARRVA